MTFIFRQLNLFRIQAGLRRQHRRMGGATRNPSIFVPHVTITDGLRLRLHPSYVATVQRCQFPVDGLRNETHRMPRNLIDGYRCTPPILPWGRNVAKLTCPDTSTACADALD